MWHTEKYEAMYNYFLAKGQGKNIFSSSCQPFSDDFLMSRRHKPDHISSLLGEMVERRHWQERFELHEVFTFWEKAVGKDIARHARPAKFRGKVLWLDVSDSIWMQQLQFLKTTLLAKINSQFDSVEVEDIRFQLQLPKQEESVEPRVPLRQPGPGPTGEDARRFQESLAEIDDPELREAMLRCWRTLFPYKEG